VLAQSNLYTAERDQSPPAGDLLYRVTGRMGGT
jgi:hypothetical protein